MNEVIVIGCTSNHGGKVITGKSGVIYQGKQVACIGDMHDCPKPGHGVTPIVSTPQSRLKFFGKLVAVNGARAACGAIIRGCSGNTFRVG